VGIWKAAELEPIRLQQCRHTYVTLMHARPGFSLEEIGDYVGRNSGVHDRPLPAPARGTRGARGGAVRRLLDACHEHQPNPLIPGIKSHWSDMSADKDTALIAGQLAELTRKVDEMAQQLQGLSRGCQQLTGARRHPARAH